MPTDRGLAGTVGVSIKDYKIKVENSKQKVLYNITVKIKGDTYKVRRTYSEFDKLYRSIRKNFPLDIYPYMNFPVFPIFAGSTLNTEEKTIQLNEFLNSLCCPEFMIEETLDFLNIHGEFREKLQDEHQDVIDQEKGINIIETEEIASLHKSFCDNKVSVFEKSNKVHTNLHIYFQVSIEIMEISNKTDYIIA